MWGEIVMNLTLYQEGCKDGIPIALGYLSVSFTFGMLCVSSGVDVLTAFMISLLNLTSAGQFSGLQLMLVQASLAEVALSQFIINIRYALMSLSLSQKIESKTSGLHRMGMAFGITDEIFALASLKEGKLKPSYMYGLITTPVIGWTLGTLLGATLFSILPLSIQDALGIAIYAMFIAIIIPPAKKSKPILYVIIIAILIACICTYLQLSQGFITIIAGVCAAAIIAYLYPIKEA